MASGERGAQLLMRRTGASAPQEEEAAKEPYRGNNGAVVPCGPAPTRDDILRAECGPCSVLTAALFLAGPCCFCGIGRFSCAPRHGDGGSRYRRKNARAAEAACMHETAHVDAAWRAAAHHACASIGTVPRMRQEVSADTLSHAGAAPVTSRAQAAVR